MNEVGPPGMQPMLRDHMMRLNWQEVQEVMLPKER